jgi:hypothetical protein
VGGARRLHETTSRLPREGHPPSSLTHHLSRITHSSSIIHHSITHHASLVAHSSCIVHRSLIIHHSSLTLDRRTHSSFTTHHSLDRRTGALTPSRTRPAHRMPCDARMTTSVLPLASGREAISHATLSAAPADGPHMMPSSVAAFFANSMASAPLAQAHSSITPCGRVRRVPPRTQSKDSSCVCERTRAECDPACNVRVCVRVCDTERGGAYLDRRRAVERLALHAEEVGDDARADPDNRVGLHRGWSERARVIQV